MQASIDASVGEWVRFHEAAAAGVEERGVSRWPLDSKPDSSLAVDSLLLVCDDSAGAVTVSIEGRDLVARGDRRSMALFLQDVHFLAAPDLFPGSLSDHGHLEHIDSPGYHISAESLPLNIHRWWDDD